MYLEEPCLRNRATYLKGHSNLQASNLQASIFSLRFLRASREFFKPKNNIRRPKKEGQKVRMAEYQNECTLKNRVCETGHSLHEGHSNIQDSNILTLSIPNLHFRFSTKMAMFSTKGLLV
jgi:hypothetical protein